jgi:hypothetical protein
MLKYDEVLNWIMKKGYNIEFFFYSYKQVRSSRRQKWVV